MDFLQGVERIMDFYIIVSLVVVFGLLVWWLFLAISALRNESQGDERDNQTPPGRFCRDPMKRPSGSRPKC